MDDFLKNLQKSLEKGEVSKEITDQHYNILQGAGMVDLLKVQQSAEENIHKKEVNDFLNKSLDDDLEKGRIQRDKREDEKLRIDEVLDYTGTKEEMQAKVKQAVIDGEEFEKKRKKRELIELNTAHIKMLGEENEQYQKKILKNNELIEYLKKEMDRA